MTRGPQVMGQLAHLGPADNGQGLQLDQDVIVAKEVRPVDSAKTLTTVPDRDGDLAAMGDCACFEFQLQRVLVGHFQITRAQLAVDAHRSPDDRERPRVAVHDSPMVCSIFGLGPARQHRTRVVLSDYGRSAQSQVPRIGRPWIYFGTNAPPRCSGEKPAATWPVVA